MKLVWRWPFVEVARKDVLWQDVERVPKRESRARKLVRAVFNDDPRRVVLTVGGVTYAVRVHDEVDVDAMREALLTVALAADGEIEAQGMRVSDIASLRVVERPKRDLVWAQPVGSVELSWQERADQLIADAGRLNGLMEKALPRASQLAAQHEPGIQKALGRLWRAHRSAVRVSSVRAAIVAPAAARRVVEALQLDSLAKMQTAALKPLLHGCVMAGAKHGAEPLAKAGIDVKAAGDATLSFGRLNPKALAWAEERAGALVTGGEEVQTAVHDIIVNALGKGVDAGRLAEQLRASVGLDARRMLALDNYRDSLNEVDLGDDRVDAMVASYADELLQDRAETIAATETIDAFNSGQQMLWDEAVDQGVLNADEFLKHWIVTDDGDACDECEGNAEDDVPIDEDFASGDDTPPAHPRCRCAMGLVSAGEK